jgi:hypothetical protein
MTNPYKDKPWFKFLSNKYVWVLLFCHLMLFLDNYSYRSPSFRQTNQRIRGQRELLGRNKKRPKEYQTIKESRTDRKIPREILYEKDSEDIYIIEFEGDTIEKNKIPSQPLLGMKCEIYSNY